MFGELIPSLLHGPTSLLVAFGSVELPMLAGLMQGRAPLR
jgi:hypothetical protein